MLLTAGCIGINSIAINVHGKTVKLTHGIARIFATGPIKEFLAKNNKVMGSKPTVITICGLRKRTALCRRSRVKAALFPG